MFNNCERVPLEEFISRIPLARSSKSYKFPTVMRDCFDEKIDYYIVGSGECNFYENSYSICSHSTVFRPGQDPLWCVGGSIVVQHLDLYEDLPEYETILKEAGGKCYVARLADNQRLDHEPHQFPASVTYIDQDEFNVLSASLEDKGWKYGTSVLVDEVQYAGLTAEITTIKRLVQEVN